MIAPSLRPVQLCLELRTRTPGRRPSPPKATRPYWDHADLADIGGELRARASSVRTALNAVKRSDCTWVGSYDLLLGHDGTSGSTKAQATRQDALVSAAYGVAEYCESVLGHKAAHVACDVRAAAQVLRWLNILDLL